MPEQVQDTKKIAIALAGFPILFWSHCVQLTRDADHIPDGADYRDVAHAPDYGLQAREKGSHQEQHQPHYHDPEC